MDYYDINEKNKLSKYPNSKTIDKLIQNNVIIPTSEFLTYYLFRRKRQGKTGWSSFSDLSKLTHKSLEDLEDFIDFNGTSINDSPDIQYQDKVISERIGESIGMSVVNQIYGMTNADWGRIHEHPGPQGFPTFDYEEIIGSDGNNIIQIEAKGSSVQDNTRKTSSISNHKKKIENKKIEIKKLEKKNLYLYPANVRYGTIVVTDSNQRRPVKCWILDPDSEFFDIDPFHLRIINRMRFLLDWIAFIWPRSQLTSALATRIKDLISIKNPLELDKIPLQKRDRTKFDIQQYDPYSGVSPWFNRKSHVINGPAGGHVFQLSSDAFFFLGIQDDLLNLAAKQNFEDIIKYKRESGFIYKTVNCIISEGRFLDFKLPDYLREKAENIDGYYSFKLEGQLHYSREGVVFGILPIKKKDEV